MAVPRNHFLDKILTESEKKIEGKVTRSNDIATLAKRFAAKEAISKAIGYGFSKGIYKSLNCGRGSKDNKINILKNLNYVSKKMSVPKNKLILMNQTHSSNVIEIKKDNLKRKINVIFTPGHDYSEISLHDEYSRIIFSGDHILPRITPFIPVQNEDSNLLKGFLDSLDKVHAVDHDIIAPGHGNIISTPHKRIEQMKLHHQRRSDKILEFLKKNDLTGWELTNQLFPRKLDSLNLRLAFQETLAHLHLLRSNNDVSRNSTNGIKKWSLKD